MNSVREALKKKSSLHKVQVACERLQLAQRRVRGSEASRDDIIPKFMAMRIWNGCSSLFSTLNPHDIRSPLTLTLLQGSDRFKHRFSLDFTDAEAERYPSDYVQDDPRRIHPLVAGNPLAATRCFHWTVRLVLRTLFNVDDPKRRSPDCIPAREAPWIFGHIAAL